MLKSMGIEVPEIDGNHFAEDPLEKAYSQIESQLKNISWDEFEKLTEKALSEIGFLDVQRLTRGSQQGKDVIGTWVSRFTYGRECKFRFQCKHTSKNKILKKSDVGDSIADFLAQNNDEILIIVTNAALSNDLIDQLDRLCEKGVFAIASKRAFRFFASAISSSVKFTCIDKSDYNWYSHYFDFRNWFDSLLTTKSENGIIFSLYRYWTEPYTWFFYKSDSDKTERIWTTDGGEFCFSIINESNRIIDISDICLEIISITPLPELGIINTTPKGGHNLPRFDIHLTHDQSVQSLVEHEKVYLSHNECYSCIMNFKGKDPGIYKFRVRCPRVDGDGSTRESEIYEIAYLGDENNQRFIRIHESWPESLLLIDTIFNLDDEERERIFTVKGQRVSLFRNESGKLVMKYHTSPPDKIIFISDLPELDIEHPLAPYIPGRMPQSRKLKYIHLEGWSDWIEEFIDSTEPRAPISRAEFRAIENLDKNNTIDALNKGHERTPMSRISNILLYDVYTRLGLDGFAKFHLNIAYISAPWDPEIAAIHCKSTHRNPDEYVAKLRGPDVETFRLRIEKGKGRRGQT